MSFEAAPLLAWTRRLREEDPLPVRRGSRRRRARPGCCASAPASGWGAPAPALDGSGMLRLLGPGQWDPGPLLAQLASAAAEPGLALHGPHLYTFNAVRAAREAVTSW